MNEIRHTFYKVILELSNSTKLPIFVATKDIERVGPLVEKNKVLYGKGETRVTRFFIEQTVYSLSMLQKQYEEELEHCDIVDE